MKPIEILVGVDGRTTINAHVFGLWAAHVRLYAEAHRWTVTHVPSGMALPYFEDTSPRIAIETARLLGECRVNGRLTKETLTGRWRHMLEAVCAPAFLGEQLPWTAVAS